MVIETMPILQLTSHPYFFFVFSVPLWLMFATADTEDTD